MRARQPDQSATLERSGVRIYYEVCGDGSPTLLLLPAWSIVHSRMWKAQVPYLARHFRVVTFDGRGNGRSDRPVGADAYRTSEFVADALAVLDATDTERAIVIGLSRGGHYAAVLAARHPERVLGAMLIAPASPFGPRHPGMQGHNFVKHHDNDDGWARFNRHYWQRDYQGFAEFFFSECFPERHSTKQIEDCVGWALETSADTLIDTVLAAAEPRDEGEALYRTIRRPVVVVQGDNDRIVPKERGEQVSKVIGAPLVVLEGAGHMPIARDPVPMNHLIHDFAVRTAGGRERPRMIHSRASRNPRALYLSSPIGLGHGRRDLAIAKELRMLRPDLEIDWLTQHPVTRLLEEGGETVHAASRLLASESRHIEEEAGEHDLHVFQSLRNMDEIFVANFMLFQEVVEDGAYDLIIADESWDVDHFWHENPELKRGALAWFTDFVGYLPMPEGGDREAYLTADYNAEMLEHIERYPRIRDRAIFVGKPADIVPGTFGKALPEIRGWTERHFDFCGYITGRSGPTDRDALRQRFGYAPDENICIVTVGGSGVGIHLLRRIIDACPAIRRHVPSLRMIVAAGPRIDPRALPCPPGVEVHGYVPNLDERLAACDIALVQGGLTTCMELTAANVPFLYFPLARHFEQNLHVRHRLQQYRAGRPMSYETATPDEIAAALVEELRRKRDCLPVETGGARRAAHLLSELL